MLFQNMLLSPSTSMCPPHGHWVKQSTTRGRRSESDRFCTSLHFSFTTIIMLYKCLKILTSYRNVTLKPECGFHPFVPMTAAHWSLRTTEPANFGFSAQLTWVANDLTIWLFEIFQIVLEGMDQIMTVKLFSQFELMGKSLFGPQCISRCCYYTVWPLWKSASKSSAPHWGSANSHILSIV